MKKQLLITVVVAVIVAIAASLLTLSITGNVIKVSPVSNVTSDVYTRAEVDSLLAKVPTTTIGRYMWGNGCRAVTVSGKPLFDPTKNLSESWAYAECNATIVNGVSLEYAVTGSAGCWKYDSKGNQVSKFPLTMTGSYGGRGGLGWIAFCGPAEPGYRVEAWASAICCK